MKEMYKYQGAGNDFIVIDGRVRAGKDASYVDEDFIRSVCDRRYGIGADGVMVLEDSDSASFRMTYYNSDGTGGMMCGNGGRCIAAFALDLGIAGLDFEAADGLHCAQLMPDGDIRLKLKDVESLDLYDADSCFLDTGTRHLVRFVPDVQTVDVVGDGRKYRYHEDFGPVGTNVDFVEAREGRLFIRTYEKGVEDETYACGTGIVASCLAAYVRGVVPSEIVMVEDLKASLPEEKLSERVRYDVSALRDDLSVDFIPGFSQTDVCLQDGSAARAGQTVRVNIHDVWLTGPAKRVARVILD